MIASSGRAALMSSRSPTTFVMRPGFPPEFWCTFCHFRYRSSVLIDVTCIHVPVTVYRSGVQDFLCLV